MVIRLIILSSLNFETKKLFPFAFGVDEGLTIQYVGSAFENLFVEDITGQSMYNVFDIVRPSMKVDWHMVKITKIFC